MGVVSQWRGRTLAPRSAALWLNAGAVIGVVWPVRLSLRSAFWVARPIPRSTAAALPGRRRVSEERREFDRAADAAVATAARRGRSWHVRSGRRK